MHCGEVTSSLQDTHTHTPGGRFKSPIHLIGMSLEGNRKQFHFTGGKQGKCNILVLNCLYMAPVVPSTWQQPDPSTKNWSYGYNFGFNMTVVASNHQHTTL